MANGENNVWTIYTPYSLGLSTSRLLLRPFVESDIEAVCSFRGDKQVMYFVSGAAETTEEVEAFLERTKNYAKQQPQTQYRFAIVLSSSQQVIGGCGLDITDGESSEGEIGYHLHRDFWSKGPERLCRRPANRAEPTARVDGANS